MITRHSVLLVEMLFLDSMLIIKIVTNLAWEPISQQQYISPRNTLPGTGSFWLILYWSYLKDVCLGKGSNGICTALKCCFLSIQAASWRVHNARLQLVRQALCYLLFKCLLVEAHSIVHCTKTLLHKTLEWLRLCLLGPRVKFSPSETTNSDTVHHKQSTVKCQEIFIYSAF